METKDKVLRISELLEEDPVLVAQILEEAASKKTEVIMEGTMIPVTLEGVVKDYRRARVQSNLIMVAIRRTAILRLASLLDKEKVKVTKDNDPRRHQFKS